ncbi:M16 family metallopeptidase [Kitasatospora xanthocidica]|uniref:M16 family metallopeptidase n=1 Tax=Kitasatospora xanthocidica TaxID=83382 RepID=UPI0036E3352B
MSERELHRTTLGNGLRVVLERRPGSPRTAVCVHYGVGYRSERPGQEGFAHLFEHLMFRGSASLPPGAFYDHIHPLGGQANGTTHQDYTDYHQLVPAAVVERALFAEADRMRAPVFTEHTLAEQLAGVEEEIHQAVTARPYGGLPWPLLPGVAFRGFANAHDGYGRVDQLRGATVEACQEFFRAHYAPGNAVLSVVGDHRPEQLLALVERHFADIPPRPAGPAPDLREPALAEDRWQICTEPSVTAPAVAVGYRLPDPVGDLTGYLAHVVLAEMINHHGLDGLRAVSAGCGVFGPLDARDPDLLVLTALVPPGESARRAVETVTGQWAGWADDPRFGQRRAQAVRRLLLKHHRQYADAYARSRALGCLELLFGRAELLDEYPALLGEVDPALVAAAARRLGTAAKGVLVMNPGPTRTRPAPDHGTALERDTVPDPGRPTSTGGAPGAPGTPGTSGSPSSPGPAPARPVPPPAVQPAPRHGPRCETRSAGGTRVVAVRDTRSPLVELRFRLPLHETGWRDPQDVDALVRLLAERTDAAARAEAVGGLLHLVTDGQWFDVTGCTTPARAGHWLGLLRELLLPLDGVTPLRVPQRPRSPEALMDTALRRYRLGGPAGRPEAAPAADLSTAPSQDGLTDLAEVHRAVLGRGGGWLVAVGDLDPERFAAEAEQALPDRPAPPSGGSSAPRAAAPTGGALALHHEALELVHLTLSAPEPPGDSGAAARFLATAVTGVHPLSRLAVRALDAGLHHPLHSGRDLLLDEPRAYVRAVLPPQDAARALDTVRAALRGLRAEPVTAAELEPIRSFCAAQLLGAFDTPATKADLLRDGLSAGRPLDWAEHLPDALRRATAREVAAACAELYPADAMTLVALGSPGPVADLTDHWSRA